VSVVVAIVLACTSNAHAAREPVLKQVAHPHNYYWRELFMPQLTSGPSAGDFMPDGERVVYSMGGSLWLQQLGTDTATELTHGPGYDYQPDVSPDGRHVVFARQHRDTIELYELELATGKERQLTRDRAAAVEPRYSPDGNRIAFTSSRDGGLFTVYLAPRGERGTIEARRVFAERQSPLRRYYYAATDHVINPSWSADGERLYFVSNRGEAWGTGGIWSAALDAPEDWQRVVNEETTWSARPQLSPDGKRLLYASYQGRQWHQLWLTTPQGEAPLPLTFGEFDRRDARWSADGERVLYISNEGGNTSLWVQEVTGGARAPVRATKRIWQRPMQVLALSAHDAGGKLIPARFSVLAADGRHYGHRELWIRGDDLWQPDRQQHETHYFHCPGECALAVPRGKLTVTAHAGFARHPVERTLEVGADDAALEIRFEDNALPAEFGDWLSLDQHVHMNYGGHYRNTVETLAQAAAAEDLDVLYNLVVNKEQRVNDIAEFRPGPQQFGEVTIFQSQEFHTSYWGHMGLLHLADHVLTPDFSAYRHTALASPWPHNGRVAELAHAQGALVGYVHPFDWPIDPATEKALSNALPADVAHGNVDYLEVVAFSDHFATAGVWHRLLNLGYRLPAGAGTDAMANYASLRGPVGLNRVFLNQSDRSVEALKKGMREGRGFVSNGPLIALRLDEHAPGDVLALDAPGEAQYRVVLRSAVPLQTVELLVNGKVAASFRPARDGNGDWSGRVKLTSSGWVLARAYGEATPLVYDIYPYASTNPVWVEVAGQPARSPEDAAFFVGWLERVIADAAARTDWNTEQERRATLEYLEAARAKFEAAR
jgi:hypothetical protein